MLFIMQSLLTMDTELKKIH